MTMQTKNEVFKEYLAQYLKATKVEQGAILDHVCFVTKMHNFTKVEPLYEGGWVGKDESMRDKYLQNIKKVRDAIEGARV